MAKVRDLQIIFKPLGLDVKVAAPKVKPGIRNATVVLEELDINVPAQCGKLLVTDIVEYICPKLYEFGIVLSYAIADAEGKQYLKSVSISRQFGKDLTNGSAVRVFEAKAFDDHGNCWNWRASFTSGGDDKAGRTINELNQLDPAGIKSLVFDFGVAEPTF